MADCDKDKCDLVGPEQIVMLTNTTCPHCREAKDLMQEKGILDKVLVLDETSESYKKLTKEKGVDGVPTFLVGDKVCDLGIKEKNDLFLQCDDGSEVDL